jgi:hypothetical protein
VYQLEALFDSPVTSEETSINEQAIVIMMNQSRFPFPFSLSPVQLYNPSTQAQEL